MPTLTPGSTGNVPVTPPMSLSFVWGITRSGGIAVDSGVLGGSPGAHGWQVSILDANTLSVFVPLGALADTYNIGTDQPDTPSGTFDVADAPPVCTYAIDPTSQSVSAAAGSNSADVTTQDGCAWSATANDSWLRTTASGTDSGSAPYSYDQNLGPARTGTLTIAGQTLTLTQAGGCLYAITPADVTVPSPFGSQFVDISTTSESCPWTTHSNNGWLFSSIAEGVGTGGSDISWSRNTTGVTRVGTVTMAGLTFTVTQLPEDESPTGPPACAYSLTMNHLTVSSDAGTGSANVETTYPTCLWTSVSHDGWIEDTTSGAGNGPSNFAYTENTSHAPRVGTIRIAGILFTLTQLGKPALPPGEIGSPSGGVYDNEGRLRRVCENAKTTLSWDAVDSFTGYTVAGYNLYRDGTLIYHGPLLTFTDTPLIIGQRYAYQLATYSDEDEVGVLSAPYYVTPCPVVGRCGTEMDSKWIAGTVGRTGMIRMDCPILGTWDEVDSVLPGTWKETNSKVGTWVENPIES